MQDNEKKPALRFKGFTDPWEQRKLGEIAVFSKGVGYSKNDLCEEGTPIILYGRLYTKYETCIFDVDTFVKEKAGSVYSKGGEVIVPASGETAEDISIASVVVKPGILLGGDLNIVSPTAEYDSAFLALTISSGATHKYLSSLAQGKSVVHLHNSDIQSVSAKFPTKREQEKIHLIFGKIDTLITLHQRKYEKLVNIKKSMLDKMFPKNGASVPEIRFKGFTDPWEQRKLSELTSMHARIGWQNLRTSEFLDSGDYMLITGTDFDDGTVNYSTCHFVERERYEQDKNIQIRNGSILITKDGTLGKVAYVQGLSMPATLNAGVFNVEIRNTSIVDERYLFQYLKAPFLMDYVDKKATGGTIKHLNQNILVDFPVVMPKKTEQVSIGNFFQRIDTLITLHQRKLEKLQNIKKSCLEKMFV